MFTYLIESPVLYIPADERPKYMVYLFWNDVHHRTLIPSEVERGPVDVLGQFFAPCAQPEACGLLAVLFDELKERGLLPM